MLNRIPKFWDFRRWRRLTHVEMKKAGLWVLYTGNAAALLHLVSMKVYIGPMFGPSMLPTFANSGDFSMQIVTSPRNIRRGDLVVLESPITPRRFICKRVIGLPGDVICVDPTGEKVPSTEHVVVPKGHWWIMGDNAAYSRDSRDYGPVAMGLLRGKIIARVLPLSKFTIFRNETNYIE